ncbi:unnamed protein product [Miscanthus lutarioriparius]|uniref:Uncharacterized protein n=1 Tax=Miscanthus lutarioriparius TaxID=422564 RepID=A0A811S170_9POAL|nr:unnamed protein product [Miscanthus lutarioriparius]
MVTGGEENGRCRLYGGWRSLQSLPGLSRDLGHPCVRVIGGRGCVHSEFEWEAMGIHGGCALAFIAMDGNGGSGLLGLPWRRRHGQRRFRGGANRAREQGHAAAGSWARQRGEAMSVLIRGWREARAAGRGGVVRGQRTGQGGATMSVAGAWLRIAAKWCERSQRRGFGARDSQGQLASRTCSAS